MLLWYHNELIFSRRGKQLAWGHLLSWGLFNLAGPITFANLGWSLLAIWFFAPTFEPVDLSQTVLFRSLGKYSDTQRSNFVNPCIPNFCRLNAVFQFVEFDLNPKSGFKVIIFTGSIPTIEAVFFSSLASIVACFFSASEHWNFSYFSKKFMITEDFWLFYSHPL